MSRNELLLIDTTQTQRYIFGSNRLMENIGGSYLVAMATEQWVLQTVYEKIDKHNVRPTKGGAYEIDPNRHFEKDGLMLEVLVAGGGNSILLGRDQETVATFLTHYSRRLLKDAPDIPIYTAQHTFAWEENPAGLATAIGTLMGPVADEAKRTRPHSQQLLGMGVTVACRATGLPAVQMSQPVSSDDSPYPISAEIAAKHRVADRDRLNDKASLADHYLRRELPIDETKYRYPGDFDDMVARQGEANYIAIVHADGDGIGDRLKALGSDENWSNRHYIEKRRAFSNDLKMATRQALRATLASLTKKLHDDSDRGEKGDRLRWFYGDEEMLVELKATREGGNQFYLPFRPIISGGDDITFVCDGRIGLALALNYVNAFKQATDQLMGHPISASVGVSIVRTHYPFARAYNLAEELMEHAKQERKQEGWRDEEIGAIDWHFTVGGLYGSVEEIRRREYSQDTRSLTLRPLAVEQPQKAEERNWHTVEKGITVFQEAREPEENRVWSTRRNKVKALREALREGPEAVERFRTLYLSNQELPDIGFPDFRSDGYRNERCGYFDALELSDWYMPISAVAIDEVTHD